MIAVALGLVCWLATLILVESEFTRPIREWIALRYRTATIGTWQNVMWRKAKYFVGCHLCTGTWVAVVIASFTSYRLPLTHGWTGFILTALLIKAIGHLVLILSRVGEWISRG